MRGWTPDPLPSQAEIDARVAFMNVYNLVFDFNMEKRKN